MRSGADERADVDRDDLESDPATDTREEYTSYREQRPDAPPDEEAAREADLQPGSEDPPPDLERVRSD